MQEKREMEIKLQLKLGEIVGTRGWQACCLR
jgi:hypothetical protein